MLSRGAQGDGLFFMQDRAGDIFTTVFQIYSPINIAGPFVSLQLQQMSLS